MISRTLLPLALLGSLFLSGCGQPARVSLLAEGSGNGGERVGSVTYTDENGKLVTVANTLLPWVKSFPQRDGQVFSISVRGVSPQRQYLAQIEAGHDANDSEIVASNRGPGGQDVSCTYPQGAAPSPTPAGGDDSDPGPNPNTNPVANTNGPKTGFDAAHLMRIRIIQGDLAGLKALIESGTDINAQTEQGNTALTAAAEYGRLDAAQYLLDKGARIDLATTHNLAPLSFAAMKGQTAIVQLLCDKGANVNLRNTSGGCALNFAAAAGKTDVVRILLQFKADVTVTQNNGLTAYVLAVDYGFPETAQVLKDAGGQ